MANDAQQLDAIVRQVVSALSAAGASGGGSASLGEMQGAVAPAAPADSPGNSAAEKTVGDGRLVVSRAVVTLAEVSGLLAEIRQVVVPARAVVTPAVRDELKRRGIALVFGPPGARGAAAGSIRLVMMMSCSAADPAPVVDALRREGLGVELRTSECLIDAVDQVAAELGQGNTLGAVATEHAAAALCLANRLSGVRAVLGTDPRWVAAETAAVGANLLVLNPAALSTFQWKQLVSRFCRAPVHECPAAFRQRLG